MADFHHLAGACGCSRNVYEISIPPAATSLAQVFFDNSASSRRLQAAPVTAWLRVPLAFYHSSTHAQFPDESHASIKRSFHTPSTHSALPPTKRQFCGYCGTTLTAWNETLHAGGYGNNAGVDYLDVTLGSLLNESIDKLEALKILPDVDSDEESPQDGGNVENQDVTDESHRPIHVPSGGSTSIPVRTSPPAGQALHRLSYRGVPYFEELIEHSRLGRIKRQVGRQTSRDGSTTVSFEIVEIGDDESAGSAADPGNKRQRLDLL